MKSNLNCFIEPFLFSMSFMDIVKYFRISYEYFSSPTIAIKKTSIRAGNMVTIVITSNDFNWVNIYVHVLLFTILLPCTWYFLLGVCRYYQTLKQVMKATQYSMQSHRWNFIDILPFPIFNMWPYTCIWISWNSMWFKR